MHHQTAIGGSFRWRTLRTALLCAVAATLAYAGNAQAAAPAARSGLAAPSPAQPVALIAGQGVGDINQTRSRFGVHATDLGVMWRDSRGRVAIAFGDTYGQGWGGNGAGPKTADWRYNTLAHSTDDNLADGLSIDSMISDHSGHAAQILPGDPAVQEVTVIPTAAISVGSRDYLHYMSVRSWGTNGTWITNYSGLAYSDDGGQRWIKAPAARWTNRDGGSHFQMAAATKQGDFVYLFGTANGRFGDAYVARVLGSRMLDLSAYEYWTATGWQSGSLDRAIPVMAGPVGELSILYNTTLRRWVALHLDERRAAIVMRTANEPTGPWTGGQVVANSADHPGLYGAFLHPDSTGENLYFAMSQWAPYHVRLMRLRLAALPSDTNLVQDGGFEDHPASARTPPWTVNGRGGIDRGIGNAHSGANNGWVGNTSGWNDLHQRVVVQPGRWYRLTGWMRSSAGNAGGYFGVRRPPSQGVIAEQKFGPLPTYTRLSVDIPPSNLTVLEVFAGGWGLNGQDFWIQIDDIRLEEV